MASWTPVAVQIRAAYSRHHRAAKRTHRRRHDCQPSSSPTRNESSSCCQRRRCLCNFVDFISLGVASSSCRAHVCVCVWTKDRVTERRKLWEAVGAPAVTCTRTILSYYLDAEAIGNATRSVHVWLALRSASTGLRKYCFLRHTWRFLGNFTYIFRKHL